MPSISTPQNPQQNHNNMAQPNQEELLAARAGEMTDIGSNNAEKALPDAASTISSETQCKSPAMAGCAQFENAPTSPTTPNATTCPPQELGTIHSHPIIPPGMYPSVEQELQPSFISASAPLADTDDEQTIVGIPPMEISENHQQTLPRASQVESQVSPSVVEKPDDILVLAADNRTASSMDEVDHTCGPSSTTLHNPAAMPQQHPTTASAPVYSSALRPKYNVRVAQRDYKGKGGIFPWSMRHRNTRKSSIGRADKAVKAEISRKKWDRPRPSSRVPLFPHGDVLSQPHASKEPDFYSGIMKRYRVEKDARRASRLLQLEANRDTARDMNAKQHVPAYVPSPTQPGSYVPNPEKQKAFAAWLAQSRSDAVTLKNAEKGEEEPVQRWRSSHEYHENHPLTSKDTWVVDFHVHHMPGSLPEQLGNGHFVVCAKRGIQEAYWICTFQFSSNRDVSDDHKRTYKGQFNHVSTSFFDYRRDPGFSGHFTVDARPSELKSGRKTNTMINGQFEIYWGDQPSRPYGGQFSAFGGNCRCNFFRRRRAPRRATPAQSGDTGQFRGLLATAFDMCCVQ
jgi:hypothetical protein